jgi:hypothetical protein
MNNNKYINNSTKSPNHVFSQNNGQLNITTPKSPSDIKVLQTPVNNDFIINKVVKWNKKIENIIKKICNDSEFYKKIHIRVAQRASHMHMILMSIGIFFGPISGIMNTVETVMDPSRHAILPIISAILAFLSGVVLTVIKFASYDEISISNKMTACKYKSLEMNIKRQLSLDRKDRIDAMEYLNWIGNSYDELYYSAPLIPNSVYNNFKNFDNTSNYEHEIVIPENKLGQSFTFDIDDEEILSSLRSKNISSTLSDNSKNVDESYKIKRVNTVNTINDLLKFSDGRMIYELNRMNKN